VSATKTASKNMTDWRGFMICMRIFQIVHT